MSKHQLSFLTGTTLLIAPSLASRSPVRNAVLRAPMSPYSTSLLLRTRCAATTEIGCSYTSSQRAGGLCPEVAILLPVQNLYSGIEKYPLAKEKILNAAEHAM